MAVGDAREVLSPPTALVDPATGVSLALFTDFATGQAVISVRPASTPCYDACSSARSQRLSDDACRALGDHVRVADH